jgi:hypothetical protein
MTLMKHMGLPHPSHRAGAPSADVSEESAYDVLDRAYDPDTTLSAGAKRFIDRHVTPGAKRPPAPSVLREPDQPPARKREDGIDFADQCFNNGAMGVRTRGLDIKAGAAKLKADRATRTEAKLVVDRWNRQPATVPVRQFHHAWLRGGRRAQLDGVPSSRDGPPSPSSSSKRPRKRGAFQF